MTNFGRLCNIADRNNLSVEIVNNPEGTAIWVLPKESDSFKINNVEAVMRKAVVASPFWNYSPESSSPQLIQMLSQRGYV